MFEEFFCSLLCGCVLSDHSTFIRCAQGGQLRVKILQVCTPVTWTNVILDQNEKHNCLAIK